MLSINNVTKTFGGVVALNKCATTVKQNEIVAFVGPNGAGKTTLFDTISGLIKPDYGNITLSIDDNTEELTKISPEKVANLGISRTFQQVRLFPNLTIQDHFIIAQSKNDMRLLAQIVAKKHMHEKDVPFHKKILERYGIDRDLNLYVSDLSYGQQKLLQIAMAVMREHKIIMLDEPVAGVNAVVQKKIEDILISLKKAGETIMLVEHDMEFVRNIADRVVVMDEGSVMVDGTPEEALSDSQVLEAYLGE